MVYTTNYLKRFPLFADLNESELNELCVISSHRTFPKGHTIFHEGESSTAVYFILSGLVKLYRTSSDGQEQVISFLHSDEMFPHVGFYDEIPVPASALTLTELSVILISIEDFEELLLRKPQIAIKVMRTMGKKLLELQERIQSVLTQDVFTRIVTTLVKFKKEFGEKKGDGHIHILLPITNTDIANLLGITRESVNRAFNRLKKEGIITYCRNDITILDKKRLKELVA